MVETQDTVDAVVQGQYAHFVDVVAQVLGISLSEVHELIYRQDRDRNLLRKLLREVDVQIQGLFDALMTVFEYKEDAALVVAHEQGQSDRRLADHISGVFYDQAAAGNHCKELCYVLAVQLVAVNLADLVVGPADLLLQDLDDGSRQRCLSASSSPHDNNVPGSRV